ncbi:hypothetical protein [Legionella steigerwaltii]|nr:hypothetical protein [Legionella steigerwaltii]
MCGTVKKITNPSPLIVPPDKILQLLQDKECTKVKIDDETYKVLRFLVRTNGELVFAREGYPGGSIPAHWQMAGEDSILAAFCLTAGNVFFDEKNNTLKFINNKSGDFRPPFDSLQFVFPELIKAKIQLADTLNIQKLNDSGYLEQSYTVTKEKVLAHFSSAKYTPIPSNKYLGEDLNRLKQFRDEKLALNKENKFGLEYNQSIRRFYISAVALRNSELSIKEISQRLKKLAHNEFHHRHSTRRFIADIVLIISCFGGIGLFVGFGRMAMGTTFLFSDAKTAREKDLTKNWMNENAESNGQEARVFNSCQPR